MKMDKLFYQKQSLKEADQHHLYYKKLSERDNAAIFNQMMQAAYHFIGKNWPKMERVFTGKRKIHVK